MKQGSPFLNGKKHVASDHDIAVPARTLQAAKYPVIVHCHLRWDFVWQRPQQIFSRLSADHPILFLEDPVRGDGEAHLEITEPLSNVFRAVPVLPETQALSYRTQCEAVLTLVNVALREHRLLRNRFNSPVQWFYSPMPVASFLGQFGAIAVVYDCMDELANFRFAPPEIAERERELLAAADVVFTGGYRLYKAKSRSNENTHFFGCGVDAAHFGKATLASTAVPEELANLPRPVLGYFGVIDERLDYVLIERLAQTFPNASIAMVGPVAKVDPATLPQLPNIHWLGQRDYDELPAIVKGFDVCMMPFAMNEATEYINPTKTLEYMAAGKPIVSTAVPDVMRNFTPIVQIAHSTEEYLSAVRRALRSPDPKLIAEGIASAQESSWDSTVSKMRELMLGCMQNMVHSETLPIASSVSPPATPASIAREGSANNKKRKHAGKRRIDVLVVGAGFSGSVAAQRLASHGFSVLVVDKRPHIGGNAYDTTDAHGILIHPYGPHLFHTNGAYIAEYLSQFTRWRPYEHRVLAKVGEQFVPLPINIDTVNRLYGLRLTEDSIEHYFASVREARHPVVTSEDVVINSVGRDLYEKFFRGYTRKQWGLDPSELAASVAARIPTRTNHDDRYFTDSFQKMPVDGYTRMFERMLDDPRINVEVDTDYFAIKDAVKPRQTVYTGPIDAYFDLCYGRLPYRSIRFEHCHFDNTPRYQPVGTVNFPNDFDYTRITEFKHLTGQQHTGTSIVYEYPEAEGDPYYPVPRPANEALFKRYKALARQERDVTFVGRLAQYRYYNMDQCVGAALKSVQYVLQKLGAVEDKGDERIPSVSIGAQSPAVVPSPMIADRPQ